MFATGVTIVTARNATGQPIGLTANSFNSVSLDPPLVLWSLSRAAASMPAFANGSHYAINVLAADQKALAERFGIPVLGRHTALGDAMVTAEVWLHLLGQLQAMGIHTLGQAREAAQQTYFARLKY